MEIEYVIFAIYVKGEQIEIKYTAMMANLTLSKVTKQRSNKYRKKLSTSPTLLYLKLPKKQNQQ